MKNLSNTEAELKKSIAYKKKRVFKNSLAFLNNLINNPADECMFRSSHSKVFLSLVYISEIKLFALK